MSTEEEPRVQGPQPGQTIDQHHAAIGGAYIIVTGCAGGGWLCGLLVIVLIAAVCPTLPTPRRLAACLPWLVKRGATRQLPRTAEPTPDSGVLPHGVPDV